MNELDLHGFTHKEALRAAEDFLIGESFMKSKNIQSTVESILFGRKNV